MAAVSPQRGTSEDLQPRCDGEGDGAKGQGSDAASEPNAKASEERNEASADVGSPGAGGEHGDRCGDSSAASSPTEQHEAPETGRLASLQEELEALENAAPLSVRLRDRLVDSTQAPLPVTMTNYRVIENNWQICTQASLSGLLARTGHL